MADPYVIGSLKRIADASERIADSLERLVGSSEAPTEQAPPKSAPAGPTLTDMFHAARALWDANKPR